VEVVVVQATQVVVAVVALVAAAVAQSIGMPVVLAD
jgi:hypothetical protein